MGPYLTVPRKEKYSEDGENSRVSESYLNTIIDFDNFL